MIKRGLGSVNDLDDILAHPWLSQVDTSAILNKQLEVPIKPKLSTNILDVSNFR